MKFTFIHTNDLHGKLTGTRLPFLLKCRERFDFYFDSGDCVKSGNLSRPLGQEGVWGMLSQAKCTASVIGNRETHLLKSAFDAKLAGAAHPVLCANLYRKDGTRPLGTHISLEKASMRIGVFGVSVVMVKAGTASSKASAFLWTDPKEEAVRLARDLKRDHDVVIALTHIGFQNDLALAEACPDIDIILGGHTHMVLEAPLLHHGSWICQGGSHAHLLGEYQWEDGQLKGGPHPWA